MPSAARPPLREGVGESSKPCEPSASRARSEAQPSGVREGRDPGGEGGIRTLEARKRLAVFKTAAFNHSATSPKPLNLMRILSLRQMRSSGLLLDWPGASCFPSPRCWIPEALQTVATRYLESCRRRRVDADVDGAIALYKEVAARQTELNETNRRRNEHQASGKRKMEPAEREAHTAEGRALKEAVARVEAALAKTRAAFEEALAAAAELRPSRGSRRRRGRLPGDPPGRHADAVRLRAPRSPGDRQAARPDRLRGQAPRSRARSGTT